jgi:hypothetical protein
MRNIWRSHSQPVQKPNRRKEKHLINEKNQTMNDQNRITRFVAKLRVGMGQ